MSTATTRSTTLRTRAAMVVVVLAVVLGGVGLMLAIRQTRLLEKQRVAAARSEAERLAAELYDKVSRRTAEALAEVSAAWLAQVETGRTVGDPLHGERRPSWLGDLFIWDGRELQWWPGLDPPPNAPPQEPDRIERLQELITGRLLPRLLFAYVGSPEDRLVLLEEHIGDQPVVLAHVVAETDDDALFLVAVSLDLDRLRRSYLEPLMSGIAQRIQLVDTGTPSPAWSEPLPLGLSFWTLQPTRRFIEFERTAVRRQTGIFVGITVLAMLALLAVVWGLIHVVQREVALSQLKSNFVADVSHELKTPLALIRLFGETLAEGRVQAPEKRQEYYEIIKRESTRLTHLINNILDFARIEAGRKEYKMVPVDVAQVVRETYESYRHDLEHHGFEHRLRLNDNLPQILGDPDAIAQAILNLIGNAIKYSDTECFLAVEVTCETRRDRHGVLISIEDRGIGLPPAARRHLFEGFYRVPDERVRRQRGAGLGLGVVKHIVDAHGGSIDVESRLVKGSTFRIFLPEMPATETPEGPASPA